MAAATDRGKATSPRRLAQIFGALAFLGGLAWWGCGRIEAQRHWRAAQDALEAQDVEGARRHLAECVRYWPDDPAVRFWAARAARQAEAYEEAEEHLTDCERLGQFSSSAVRFERLLLRAQVGEGQELRRLVAGLDGTQPERFLLALEALARGYAATMHDAEAGRFLDLLLEREPDHVPGLLLRARRLSEAGQEAAALECYAKVLARAPDALEPRLGMAKTLLVLGRLPEAVQLYETLRQVYPDHPEVLYRLSQCRVDLSQPDEAERLLDRLQVGHPNHVEGLLERGRLEFRRGHAEEAANYLRRALAADPRHPEALDALAICLEAQGKQSEAEECRARRERGEVEYGRVARLKLHAEGSPGDTRLLRAAAAALLRLGKEEEAVAWYFAILQQDPQQADVHRALAECLQRAGQPHRAARHRQLAQRIEELQLAK